MSWSWTLSMNTTTGSTESGREWLQRICDRAVRSSTFRVDMYVRSLAPSFGVRRQQESVFDRLRSLRESGPVDDINLSVWGDGVCVDGPCAETPACRRLRDRIERFRSWAADCEYLVSLPFDRRSVTSSIVDEAYEEILTPDICLAVHTDAGLTLVLPCTVDDETVCVPDFLDVLEGLAVDTTAEA